ncbi:WD40/YVTN/BNR-like repeat-containing protein [Streptomyces sp. H39-C1]|uniref:WD40/YVTN/BNR-like repeat-containing protein n=1 Tax=Streptomyces sp. H39-C1 TaxID=3004355 RepID=UPI0022AEEB98|nr:sialidase family protein [Streptomyces sp. H39-C1]MCZ4095450.1 1,4-beta-glucanase [Streptomyces sp. H39-C1]
MPLPSRRGVLLGSAAGAAAAALPAVPARAAQPDTHPARPHRWRTVAIGGAGFVTGVLFHPAVRGLAYARTDIGGAYRWEERTARWTALNDSLGWDDWNLLGVEAMAVDPSHPDRLYLAVGTYAQSWASPGAVLRSDDRGATWSRTDLTVRLGANEDGRGTGERLLVDPRNSSVLWLGTRHDGLWKSSDRGASWARAEAFPGAPSATGQGVTFLAAAGRVLYAGWGDGGSALYRTTDGMTWEAVPGQPTGANVRTPQRAVHSCGILYVTYADAPGPNGMADGSVWRLDTAAGTWRDITPVQPAEGDRFGYAGLAADARRPGTVIASTNNRWGSVDTLFRTTDGGLTWTSLKDTAVLGVTGTPYLRWGEAAPKFGWWIQTVGIDPHDSRHVVYGTGATVFGTRDLVHWAPQIRGLEETAVTKLISPPTGAAHLLSALGDIGGFYHDSLDFSPAAGMYTGPVFGSTTGLDQAALKPSYVVRTGWSSTRNGAYSEDGGRSWTPFAAQPEQAANAPGPVCVSADGRTLLWSLIHWSGTTYPTQRSTDDGAHWTEVGTFPQGATPVADPVDPARCYAYDTGSGTLFVSTDASAVFTAAATGLPAGDTQYRIGAAPGRCGDLWLSAKDSGLLRSTDGGATFVRVPGVEASYTLGFGRSLTPRGYPALFHVARINGVTGVFRSDDAGASWLRINDDAHQWGWTGQTITGDPRIHGRVYLGTNGRGIQYADAL